MPLHRQATNLATTSTQQLVTQLSAKSRFGMNWDDATQQYVFARAMEVLRRPNADTLNRIYATRTLDRLVRREGRTWTNNHPTSNSVRRGQYNIPSPAAVHSPNYSKASTAVKKWLAVRPHTIHQNVVTVKLPANAMDPVWHKNFTVGNEAVMVIKKRLQSNGALRSKRTFYNKNTIGSMAARAKGMTGTVPWRTILRMRGSDPVFKDPINRRTVYRRDLMNVKFVA